MRKRNPTHLELLRKKRANASLSLFLRRRDRVALHAGETPGEGYVDPRSTSRGAWFFLTPRLVVGWEDVCPDARAVRSRCSCPGVGASKPDRSLSAGPWRACGGHRGDCGEAVRDFSRNNEEERLTHTHLVHTQTHTHTHTPPPAPQRQAGERVWERESGPTATLCGRSEEMQLWRQGVYGDTLYFAWVFPPPGHFYIILKANIVLFNPIHWLGNFVYQVYTMHTYLYLIYCIFLLFLFSHLSICYCNKWIIFILTYLVLSYLVLFL